jgi:hypothetical protein
MPFEITNSLRSASIIRVVDAGTANVTLAQLAKNANETVTSASIKRVIWSTNGSISITRDGVPVLALHGSGDMRPSDSGHIIANNSTANIAVTIVTGGSAIVEVTKDTTYTTPLTGI